MRLALVPPPSSATHVHVVMSRIADAVGKAPTEASHYGRSGPFTINHENAMIAARGPPPSDRIFVVRMLEVNPISVVQRSGIDLAVEQSAMCNKGRGLELELRARVILIV